MFWVYSVLTHISQIAFRQVFVCLLTLFLSFVYARYYSAIPVVDYLLIGKCDIFYLCCYQKLLATLWLLRCLLIRIRKSSFIHNNNSQYFRRQNPTWKVSPFLIIMHFFHTPCFQRELELKYNKVLVLRCTKGVNFHQIELKKWV